MKKYSFLVDGIPVGIYSASEFEIANNSYLADSDTEGIKVMLTADSQSDFRLEYLDKNNTKPREPHIPLAALSCFLKVVRGYPDMTLDITTDKGVYKLYLSATRNYNFVVNDVKCKVLCTKTVDFYDGISFAVDVIDQYGSCGVVVCNDTECFDKTRATLLNARLRQDGITTLIIASYIDRIGIISLGDIMPHEAIAIGISAISSRGISLPYVRYTASVNGVDIALQLTSRSITFYPEIKYIS